jgi:hypothetical protein
MASSGVCVADWWKLPTTWVRREPEPTVALEGRE